MDKLVAINTLYKFNHQGRYVFHFNDLKHMFSDDVSANDIRR